MAPAVLRKVVNVNVKTQGFVAGMFLAFQRAKNFVLVCHINIDLSVWVILLDISRLDVGCLILVNLLGDLQ